jgi:hypothetical protein
VRALLVPILLVLVALGLLVYALSVRRRERQKKRAQEARLSPTPPEDPPTPPAEDPPRERGEDLNPFPERGFAPEEQERRLAEMNRRMEASFRNLPPITSSFTQSLRAFSRTMGQVTQTLRSGETNPGPGAQVMRDAQQLAFYGITPELITDRSREECLADLRSQGRLSPRQLRELTLTANAVPEDWSMMVRSWIPHFAAPTPAQTDNLPRIIQAPSTPKPAEVPDEKRPTRFEREDPL